MEKINCPHCGIEVPIIPNTGSNFILYLCSLCQGQFSYNSSYGANAITSIGLTTDKTFRCNSCKREFAQASGLKRHYAVHSGDRPFLCGTCNKCFKTKAALKRHQVIHTGECPYECPTCKRRFNQISNLRKHRLIHDNKCPFYCSTCRKGFNQLSNLKKHMKVHEQRPDVTSHKNKKLLDLDVKRPVLTFVRPADELMN